MTIKALYPSNGRKVGIGFANEQSPDSWFIGVQEGKYDVIVLWCKHANGNTKNFVLPREFIETIWDFLSRDKKAKPQVKFNVKREGDSYYLSVPRLGRRPLDDFIDNYDSLID